MSLDDAHIPAPSGHAPRLEARVHRDGSLVVREVGDPDAKIQADGDGIVEVRQ